MSERYSRLFSLQEALYTDGSPILIKAGALLLDNATQKILAQLKFQSISEKNIKAITVQITPMDIAERELGGPVVYQYLDLHEKRDQEFGDQTPVYVDNVAARSFRVCISEVVFVDNSIWSSSVTEWKSLPKPQFLSSVLNVDLLTQYQLDNGENCRIVPRKICDLWNCLCGAYNHSEETQCHACKRTSAMCFQKIDVQRLNEEVRERIAKEREEAEKESAERAAAEELKHKKIIKICKAMAIVAGVAIMAFLAMLIVKYIVIPNKQYSNAMALYEAGDYEEAIVAFQEMDGYKDSDEKVVEVKEAEKEAEYAEAESLFDAGDYSEAYAAFVKLGNYNDSAEKANAAAYAEAEILLKAGDYNEAYVAFAKLGDYNDSAEKANEAGYAAAVSTQENGDEVEAAILFGSLGNYQDSRESSLALWNKITPETASVLAASGCYTACLKSDGTVMEEGKCESDKTKCDVSGWKDIVAVSLGVWHTVGLKSNGTVVANGDNGEGQCNVSSWKDIVAIDAGQCFTLGIKTDGTVVATGDNYWGQCDVTEWENIAAISGGFNHTVGLKSDGTVVAVGDNDERQCNVSGWKDIVAISAGDEYTIGLKADGTVVATGNNKWGQCDVSEWEDIVAIATPTSGYYTIGLKSDGTVVSTEDIKGDVSGWKDIVAISAGSQHTVGLKADGTVITSGLYSYGDGWVTDILQKLKDVQ